VRLAHWGEPPLASLRIALRKAHALCERDHGGLSAGEDGRAAAPLGSTPCALCVLMGRVLMGCVCVLWLSVVDARVPDV
jgi:hypothetical protein